MMGPKSDAIPSLEICALLRSKIDN